MIATDGQKTFALFIYGDIEWGDDATIGFNAGVGNRSIVVTTQPLDVETGSNVGVTGLYINRIDLSSILSPDDGEKLKAGNVNIQTVYISNPFVMSNYSDVPFFLSGQLQLGSTKRPILYVKMQAVLQSMCL